MEHEVFVPFPPGTVRQALADPERVARCVPGFQWDAGSGPGTLAGRLRLRAGGSTITYHGTLRVTERDGGELAFEAEGSEARGDGSAGVTLVLRLNAADGGTSLGCDGTVRSRGRLAEVDGKAAASAGRRLLDRFAAALAADLEETPVRPAPPSAPAASGENGDGRTGRGEPGGDGGGQAPGGKRSGEKGRKDAHGTGGAGGNGTAPDGPEAGGDGDGPDGLDGPGGSEGAEDEAGAAGGGETGGLGRADDNDPVIPGIPSPEPGPDAAGAPTAKPGTGDKPGAGRAGGEGEEPRPGTAEAASAAAEAGGGTAPEAASVFETDVPPSSLDPLADDLAEADGDTPPAEAAHARRTMIGRSAEEVDHAPPRGRYAPVPAPQPASAGETLRWAAPVAAAVVASAVILNRVLRRRR